MQVQPSQRSDRRTVEGRSRQHGIHLVRGKRRQISTGPTTCGSRSFPAQHFPRPALSRCDQPKELIMSIPNLPFAIAFAAAAPLHHAAADSTIEASTTRVHDGLHLQFTPGFGVAATAAKLDGGTNVSIYGPGGSL